MYKSLDEIVEEIKNLGDLLVSYNYPMAPKEWEDDIYMLKSQEVDIDGYTVTIYFSRANHGDSFQEVLHIMGGPKLPFIPFNVVSKLAKKFLGGSALSLVELLKNGIRVYCWSILLTPDGRPVPAKFKNSEICEYEGFKYLNVDPKEVDFY